MRDRKKGQGPAWQADFEPPEPLRAATWHLEPLRPEELAGPLRMLPIARLAPYFKNEVRPLRVALPRHEAPRELRVGVVEQLVVGALPRGHEGLFVVGARARREFFLLVPPLVLGVYFGFDRAHHGLFVRGVGVAIEFLLVQGSCVRARRGRDG